MSYLISARFFARSACIWIDSVYERKREREREREEKKKRKRGKDLSFRILRESDAVRLKSRLILVLLFRSEGFWESMQRSTVHDQTEAQHLNYFAV